MEHFGSLGLSEEQADLLEVATGFCRERSPMDKVRALIESDDGFDAGVWAEIIDLGWLSIAIPEEFGGAGLSLAEAAPVMEQMGRAQLACPFFVTTLAAQALLAGGTEAQKAKYLPKIAAGDAWTLALTEPEGGWELAALRAEGVREGDEIVLLGKKQFVCFLNAVSHVVVSVMYEGKPALAIVERGAIQDTHIRRETIIDETKRSYEVNFDGVRIPVDGLCDQDRTLEALRRIELAANLLSAAEMCGAARAAIDYTVDYLNTRKQFGKLIGSYQGVKHPTVDAFVMSEKARSHLYAAAHSFNEQGVGEVAVRMAKAQADKALSYAADRAIQFHGGFGFTYECDAQLYRRCAIWNSSQYGNAAYQRKKLAELLF